jgi:hypothetical protein
MEALGSSKIITRICERGDCFVSEFVGDDDSSTKKVMRHSYADLLREGKLNDWPRYEGAEGKTGPKKPDTGLLPISHLEITWLAHRNHRIRQIAKKFFFLCRQKKKDCVGNPHDAERLKRCRAYAVRQNCAKDSETMKAAVKQVTEHHFWNHSDWGSWCRARDLEGLEREEADLKYREKNTSNGKTFYDDVRVIVDEFAEGADDMLHGWSTDIVEGFNKFFTKFLPKDRTYGMSIENKVRIHLAICIDSAGCVETYRRLSDKIGVNLGKVDKDMNILLDVRKLYLRKYRKRLVVRTKKKLIFFKKLWTQATKMVKENRKNLQYGSGISGPFAEDSQMAGTRTRTPTKTATTENSRAGMNGKTEYQYRHCALGSQANFFKGLFEK